MAAKVLFYTMATGFIVFLFLGTDNELRNLQLHHRAMWDFESCIYWILMAACGLGAIMLSKKADKRRNCYIR